MKATLTTESSSVNLSWCASTLYVPPDIETAFAQWGANCGPCALAATLKMPVSAVQEYFPDFARKPWVNPSTMVAALALAQRVVHKTGRAWPVYGLCFVQWDGPWLARGVPVAVAYKYTHWIASAMTPERRHLVYDVNADGWIPVEAWTHELVPAILETIPRAINWWLRWTCQVQFPLPSSKSRDADETYNPTPGPRAGQEEV